LGREAHPWLAAEDAYLQEAFAVPFTRAVELARFEICAQAFRWANACSSSSARGKPQLIYERKGRRSRPSGRESVYSRRRRACFPGYAE
jgi:hypothetical protein